VKVEVRMRKGLMIGISSEDSGERGQIVETEETKRAGNDPAADL
jgi:hypothetical protein